MDIQGSGYTFDEDVWAEYFNRAEEEHAMKRRLTDEEVRNLMTIAFDSIPDIKIPMKGRLTDEEVEESTQVHDIWSSASIEAETITYDNGASESKTELRFDLIPPDEIATIAKVLGQGAVKYGDDNWKALPTWTHLNHALQHIFAYLANDKSDDHLSHAATRLIFAMWSDKKEK